MDDCYFQKKGRGQIININMRNNTSINLPTHRSYYVRLFSTVPPVVCEG